MAKNTIFMYKTIDDSLYSDLNISHVDMAFSYTKDDEETPIVLESQDDTYSYYMGNSNGFWDVNMDNLKIERFLTIGNPQALFGDKGVTTAEGELGIGIHMYSRSSNFQTTVALTESITKESTSHTMKFKHIFENAELKGDIYFSVFIYLKNQIKPAPMIANITGIKLGEIDSFKIAVDGDGSIFPIVEVERVGQPLWNVIMEWTDINSDIFDTNNVRIEINSKHHMYDYLYKSTKPSRYLLVEILSSAISQIIFKVVRDSDYVSEGEVMPDSIISVVRYWVETFEADTSSLETISYSLRKEVESKFI